MNDMDLEDYDQNIHPEEIGEIYNCFCEVIESGEYNPNNVANAISGLISFFVTNNASSLSSAEIIVSMISEIAMKTIEGADSENCAIWNQKAKH